MKSTITKLYDYTKSVIPAEFCLWRIQDEELDGHLQTLSANHAFEVEATQVQMGDSVACSSESQDPYWSRPLMLFYPGRGLCAPEAENACIGAGLGDMRTITMDGKEVRLTVTRILRRSNMPIDDELAKAEGIEGVETLDAYKAWYRSTNEPTRKLHAAYRCADFLLHEIVEQSEFSIDEEEKKDWVTDRVNKIYDALVDAGYDPTIPKEGFDFLTEEQAKSNMYAQHEHFFTEYTAQSYLVKTISGREIADIVSEQLPVLASDAGMTVEEVFQKSGFAMVYGKYAYEAALEALCDYTKQFLEE